MKFDFLPRVNASLARLMSNVENEAYYNEAHETSEPVFWLVFGVAIFVALISLYIARPIRRWLGV